MKKIDPAFLEKAKKQVGPLKDKRQALWSQLDEVLLKMEPQKQIEREIRAQIKEIQETLYPIEMALSANT